MDDSASHITFLDGFILGLTTAKQTIELDRRRGCTLGDNTLATITRDIEVLTRVVDAARAKAEGRSGS